MEFKVAYSRKLQPLICLVKVLTQGVPYCSRNVELLNYAFVRYSMQGTNWFSHESLLLENINMNDII